jgi:hypothetical protein
MPAVFSGLRRGGQQESDNDEFRPHGTIRVCNRHAGSAGHLLH